MKLRELSVQTIPKHKYQKLFNSSVWCIQEMYWYQLKELKMRDVAKVVVILGDDKPNKRFGNVLTVYQDFSFEHYFGCDNHQRKRIILDILHSTMLSICIEQGIDDKIMMKAYDYCIANDLDNKWLFKNRYYISPDKRHYGAMICHWEQERFTVTAIIFDGKKNELFRNQVMSIKPYLGDFIYNSKCRWDNNVFFLESNDGEKWLVSVNGGEGVP